MKKSLKQIITDYLNSLCDELRSLIEHNKNKPRVPKLHKLGSLVIIFCTLIYLLIGCFGAIKSCAADVPTNLSGYEITVPSNWGSNSVSQFSIDFYADYYDNSTPLCNQLRFSTGSLDFYYNGTRFARLTPTDSFTLRITGGDDADNASLIQWLVDNNASFVNNNAPTSVTVPAGLYFLQNTYNDLRGTINFSVPFISRSSYFNAITFAGIDNEQYVSINYAGSNSLPNVYNGVSGWSFYEYSVILIQTDVELSESEYELFSSSFVSFADNPDLDTLFKAGQENGQSFGYSQGFDSGYSQGYTEGRTAGVAEGMESGFMSNFFGGIVQALDALKLFGNFSVLNIIEGVLGLMLALWVLKLIAGG